MNNQNSENPNPSINFHSTGGDLPLIEEKEKVMSGNTKSEERVSHPSHYTWLKDLCGVEVIDITRHMDFDLGNAIKYILRNGRKSEEGMSDKDKAIEDLNKAIFYIKDKIKMMGGEVK